MIIFHADDYGVNPKQAERILSCRREGCLNSLSVMPNSSCLQECMDKLDENILCAVHINLAEGKCLSKPEKLPLLVDKNGYFRQSFVSLLLLSFVKGHALKEQAKEECVKQIAAVCRYASPKYHLRLDSHLHYHMIPAVFCGLCEACRELGLEPEAVRWPVEPFRLIIGNVKSVHYIPFANILKNIILYICAAMDYQMLVKNGWEKKTAVFFGVFYSGNMCFSTVRKLLKRYEDYAKVRGKDLEVVFHPGFIAKGEELLDQKFAKLYHSKNRKIEKEALFCLKCNRRKQ